MCYEESGGCKSDMRYYATVPMFGSGGQGHLQRKAVVATPILKLWLPM